MPCGKRSLKKTWDKPRNIKIITPSRYEQNELSVKEHWKKVIRDLELSYKDEQFWKSQYDTVQDLMGPVLFKRIVKIFNLPLKEAPYVVKSETTSPMPSENYYKARIVSQSQVRSAYSLSDFEMPMEEEQQDQEGEEMSEQWSVSSVALSTDGKKISQSKSMVRSKSIVMSKLFSKQMSRSLSKFMSRNMMKSSHTSKIKGLKSEISSPDSTAFSDDDLEVHPTFSRMLKRGIYQRRTKNPHFEMLYCNESETDMIKWNSKYKQKVFEVSASDEFSKKAEIMTKQISKDFYDWWVGLGNVEFKSEIKRPEDIEDLFQVWFDEHASRGLVLHPKVLPCVLESIAKYIGVPKEACPAALKRQIDSDIIAETSPAHLMAFGTSLPQKMKHIPPHNNTKEMWHSVKIPEDLRTMACVWDDIQHLTSTKAFHKWLKQRPHMPMPLYLKALDFVGDKKQLFVVPSDYLMNEKSGSVQELALPVSQFSLELKEVLSKLMNQ